MPDGMGGIDPTQLEITGTLMLRGVWRVVSDWPSISILQLGGGSTSFGMAFPIVTQYAGKLCDSSVMLMSVEQSAPARMTLESQMATHPCGPLPSHLLVLSPFVSHFIGLRRAHYSFETADKSDQLQPEATEPVNRKSKTFAPTVIEQGVQQVENKETYFCPLHAGSGVR